jgi:putative oxygen-independent coproporphyrinogen III oxidase
MSSYVDACLAEYRHARAEGFGAVRSVFLGGGTPSQLPPAELVRLVSDLERQDGAEVTVEANPEDVTAEWLKACREAGVNRVSLGVQSLDATVLAGLGRSHGAEAVPAAVGRIAEAGIERYSLDLIFGGAGETDHSWRRTLAGALALDPPPRHVSAYALTVEPGTPLWLDRSRHPDDDIQAARYEMCDEMLAAAGLEWYEISNWAVEGEECRHNLNYWQQGDYRGIGCAAHSHENGRRWWNVRTPERYIKALASGSSPVAVAETLSPATRAFEGLELSLRTKAGVPFGALVAALAADGRLGPLVEPAEERFGGAARSVLTLAGRLLANEVACRLQVPEVPEGAPTCPPAYTKVPERGRDGEPAPLEWRRWGSRSTG